MIYQLYFRKLPDGRAPAVVLLYQNYDWVGEINAPTPRDVTTKIAVTDPKDSPLLDKHRNIATGDVVIDENEVASIMTPTGFWAIVEVIRDDD